MSADIEILCQELLFTQRLDYLGIPFRCSRCRDTRFLRHDCPIIRLGSVSPRPHHLSEVLVTPPPVSKETTVSIPSALTATAKGLLHNACSLFEDASDRDLAILDSVDGCLAFPLTLESPNHIVHGPSSVSCTAVFNPVDFPSPSICHPPCVPPTDTEGSLLSTPSHSSYIASSQPCLLAFLCGPLTSKFLEHFL